MADKERQDAPEEDFRVFRLLAALEAIPDPVERAHECLRVGDQIRAAHGRLGQIRRQAVYEATLKPGATGRSVADALGVSPKAVSLASSQYRQADLTVLAAAADLLVSKMGFEKPELAHLQAVRAGSHSVTMLAQALLMAYDVWIKFSLDDLDDDSSWQLYEAFERAEYLASLAKVSEGKSVRMPILAFASPSYDNVPSELVWPARVLNAMPGIIATATVYDYPDESEWALSWHILPAERYTSVFDAGPDPKGWAVSEWLIWLARDFMRSDYAVSSRVTAAPPFINQPGESMTFLIEGVIGQPNSTTAEAFADSIISIWDGKSEKERTGYYKIDWPPKVAEVGS
jgi:hypothetical protein